MTLKDKWTYKNKDTSYSTDTDNECFMYEDVKEAVLEFEKILNQCKGLRIDLELIKKYQNIMGDFKIDT